MSEYNGWTNYETWCGNMWLSNDEGTYIATRELAQEMHGDGENIDADDAVRDLAEALEAYVDEMPEVTAVTETASFVSDLLSAALGEVDWREIAENLLSEID